MDDLKAKIEALRELANGPGDPIREPRHGHIMRYHMALTMAWETGQLVPATHAAEPAPVAVEGMPEHIWAWRNVDPIGSSVGWNEYAGSGSQQYIRADPRPRATRRWWRRGKPSKTHFVIQRGLLACERAGRRVLSRMVRKPMQPLIGFKQAAMVT